MPLRRTFLGFTRPSSVLFLLFVSLNFSVPLSLTSPALALSLLFLRSSNLLLICSLPFLLNLLHCLIDFGAFHFYSRRALLWFTFLFLFWKQKLKMLTYRSLWDFKFWVVAAVESFRLFLPKLLLSQLFEVCSWTARSIRSRGIQMHRIFRTTPWWQFDLYDNKPLTQRGEMFWKNYRSQGQWRKLEKKRGYFNQNNFTLISLSIFGHGGNFAFLASVNVVNFFSPEGRATKRKLSMWS